MPSFGQWFKPFSKKKGHGGNKYHDYHSYDNLRHSNYPTTPPNMMGGGHQHQFNNGNANGNVQAPPHSFPHRQHQLYPQQLIMQSPAPPQFTQQQQPPPPPPQQQQQQQQQQPPQPQQQQQQQQPQQQQHQFQPQVITNTHNTANLATNGTTNHHHCQCYQCNSVVQQPQMQIQTNNNHHLQSPQPQQQVSQHQQSPPTQMIGHQAQMQPVLNNHVPIISTPQQQQQQQQQLPLQLQPTQTPQMQQQPQMHQQCQHIHQPTTPQQPAYQCQNNGTYGGYVNQSFTNAQPQIAQSTPQTIPQCTCQHCPHQHQHQHQPQPQHQPQQLISSPQQQQQFMQQHIEHIQTSGTCQHQVAANTMIHTGGTNLNGVNQPIQNHAHNHLIQQHSMNQSCMSHTPQQLAAPIMTSTTPLQQSNMFNTMNTQQQQFQYHTIQPHQYQQHKQQMQHQHLQQQQQQHQMQQHHRVQSLHQQQTQAIQQYAHQPLLAAQQLSAQSQTHLNYQDHSQPQIVAQQASEPRQQDELKSHDTSRYANIKTLMEDNHHTHKTDYSQSSKYQEHVYCNQKPELPPYEPPPDYETFIEHRRMYALEMNGQHLTHHSESLVLQKAKDSSYENLTRFSPYSNLGFGRQEPSFTS